MCKSWRALLLALAILWGTWPPNMAKCKTTSHGLDKRANRVRIEDIDIPCSFGPHMWRVPEFPRSRT